MARNATLLLVEDEPNLRGLVALFLRGAGYRVIEAQDGQEAVDRFADSGPFDLALVDLNLPVFSGVEVCRRVRRARPDQAILICSAAIVSEAECVLRELGVHQFLTKPYHPDELLAQVRRACRPRLVPEPLADRPAPLSASRRD